MIDGPLMEEIEGAAAVASDEQRIRGQAPNGYGGMAQCLRTSTNVRRVSSIDGLFSVLTTGISTAGILIGSLDQLLLQSIKHNVFCN